MKRITAIAILIVGTAVGSVTRASAQQSEVLAKVPFDFVVEGRTLPAGTYRIEPQGDFLLIDSLDGKAAAFATAIQGDTSADGEAELYFHVVGGERFLRRILFAGSEGQRGDPTLQDGKEGRSIACIAGCDGGDPAVAAGT